MFPTKDQVYENFLRLKLEDQLCIVTEFRKILESEITQRNNTSKPVPFDSQPIIHLTPLKLSQTVNLLTHTQKKNQKRRLKFKKRLEEAKTGTINNADLAVLAKNAARVLRQKRKIKEKISNALVDACLESNSREKRNIATSEYFKYSNLVLKKQELYEKRRLEYKIASRLNLKL